MPKGEIVINVEGGVVQSVFCSDPSAEVTLVGWDTAGALPGEPGLVRVELQGGPCNASVLPLPAKPLYELAGSDIERAIEAAHEQGVLGEPVC